MNFRRLGFYVLVTAVVTLLPMISVAQSEKDCPPPVLYRTTPWILTDNYYYVYWWPLLSNCESYSLDVDDVPQGGNSRFLNSWLSPFQGISGAIDPNTGIYYPTSFHLSMSGNSSVGTVIVEDRYDNWDAYCDRHLARGCTENLKMFASSYGQVSSGLTVHCRINYDVYTLPFSWTSDGEMWIVQHELGHAIGMAHSGSGLMQDDYQNRQWMSAEEGYAIGDIYNDSRIACCNQPVSNEFQNFL